MKNKVKEIREMQKMSQEDLCKKAKISRTTLSKIETDESANINTQTAFKIANALNTPANYIFSI